LSLVKRTGRDSSHFVSVLALHDDFHSQWVDPEFLVPQSLFDIDLSMAASEDVANARLSANGNSRGDGSWLVSELEVLTVGTVE
jgi:hypothetical protein